jgi:hypothetical protein
MGWLRPEQSLIGAPGGDGGEHAHAAIDEERPDLPVPAQGREVACARVVGASASTATATLDAGFEFCPSVARYGFPLMLKREALAGDGDGAALSDDELAAKMFVYRLMSTPSEGLSPLWATVAADGARLPPLLVARADGAAFSLHDWSGLRSFFDRFAPMNAHLAALTSSTPGPDMCGTEEDFQAKLKAWCERGLRGDPRTQTLVDRFPAGARVEAQDLKKTELNSRVGTVEQYDETRKRVGVQFGPPHGLLSIPAKNLLLLKPRADGGAASAEEG